MSHPSSPLRIAMACAPAPFGGLETVVGALAGGLRAAGHEVEVALVLDHGSTECQLARALRQAEVTVHELAVPPRRYRSERRLVRKLLAESRPMVFHSHGARCDVVDAPVARSMGIPVVSTVHGFTGGGWRNRLYERLQIRALRGFDLVVAVARALAARLAAAGVPGRNIRCILNAWPGDSFLSREEARRALGLPDQLPVLGWIGRVSREKGLDVLVQALSEMRPTAPWASIIGDGPELDRTRRLAGALGVADVIQWHGPVPAAGRLLPAFDAVVLSSRTEGTPMVLFEALSAGVPVVATTVGGVPDVVTPAEALLVPPDDPAGLAGAIRAVLEEPERARSRAAAGRSRLEREFAVGPWIGRYVTLYREVLSG